jgi:hypothetical protein
MQGPAVDELDVGKVLVPIEIVIGPVANNASSVTFKPMPIDTTPRWLIKET